MSEFTPFLFTEGTNNPLVTASKNFWNSFVETVQTAVATTFRYAADRTTLASAALTAIPVYLGETGRAGWFKFDSSNLSAKVTADTQQGIWVAPASDTTGASGAWVRQFDGPLNFKWFGAVADSTLTGAVGTDNRAALVGAIAASRALAGFNDDRYYPCAKIYVPAGIYYISAGVSLHESVHIEGDGVAHAGAVPASLFRYPAGAFGFVVNLHLTDGYDDLTVPTASTFASGSTFRNFGMFSGAYGGLWGGGANYDDNAEADGFLIRGRATLDGMWVQGFQRDNISAPAGSDGNPMLGNANCALLDNCVSRWAGRHNLYIIGTDANAIIIKGGSYDYARRWNILDLSFLGNTYDPLPHLEGGGVGDGLTAIDAIVSWPAGGQRWAVAYGQEATAATQEPGTGTAWVRVVDSSGGRTWTNGIVVRSGGAMALRPAAGCSLSVGGYTEAGQTSQNNDNAMVVGGIHGAAVSGGVTMYPQGGDLMLPRSIVQVIEGTAADQEIITGDSTGVGYILRKFRNSLMTAGAYFYEYVTLKDFFSLETETSFIYYITGRDPPDIAGTKAGRSTPVPHMMRAKNLAVTAHDDANASRIIATGSAAPASGYHAAGEIVFRLAPSAGGKLGWVCTTAGTPGTWKEFGAIDA